MNPEKFFNHYKSNGWVVGKAPMKDWKAAVHTWENNEFDKPARPVAEGRNEKMILPENFGNRKKSDPMPVKMKKKYGIQD